MWIMPGIGTNLTRALNLFKRASISPKEDFLILNTNIMQVLNHMTLGARFNLIREPL
jgi:hypothetical protein